MISITGRDDLHKIVVLNPKGGCGKTTLATNLASFFAQRGPPPTLIDCDPHGFCLGWLEKRPAHRPAIHGVQGFGGGPGGDLTFKAHPESRIAIVDLPAAIDSSRLHIYTYLADSLLLPIVPSPVDVYSATRFIAELLLDAQLDRRERRLAIVANRVHSRTRSYQMLMRFLTSLDIPMVAALRESQNYVRAAGEGIGVCELPRYKTTHDLPQIAAVVNWLERRRSVSQSQRETMIANAAYRYAERRGFSGGDPLVDWLAAEREVDASLARESS